MGKTHYLDLNTLLAYLRNRSGKLTTSFQATGRSYKGSVTLTQGQITACSIEWNNGRLEGNEALKLLQLSKEWQVHYDHTPLTSLRMPQPIEPIYTTPVPRPLRPLTQEMLNRFNAQQRIFLRLVYAQVDGHRSEIQIKAQLNLSAETVEIALDTLRNLGTIS